jgi:hypothetical protein
MHKLLNKISVAALVAASALAGCSAAYSEVLHVSPEPLANLLGDKQHRTINSAASRVKPGDVVKIHTGVYREQVYISTSGTAQNPIRFEAAPYAHVVVTGADRLLDWTKEGAAEENIFSAPWPHQLRTWAGKQTYPEDKWHELIGRTEQVFVDSYEMRQVLKREQLARGTFWVDETNKRLFVWPSNNIKLGSSIEGDPPVEASVRPILWEQAGDYVQVRGIRFRYAANQAQGGAANFKGRNAVVEDCIFERTNTVGASFRRHRCRNSPLHVSGQRPVGLGRLQGAQAAHDQFADAQQQHQELQPQLGSRRQQDRDGARRRSSKRAASKITAGVGLWFDIGLENTTVRNCLFANNENVGLFYEIAYGMHAHDNVVIGNGFASYGGAWGASGGISLASAPDCVIERNLVVGNKEGFQLREHLRRTPRIDAPPGTPEVAIWNQNIKVRNNVFAYNRDAQVWAWFETGDARYWPVALQSVMGYKPGTDKGLLDNADDYKAKDRQGVPDDLSLEKFNLQFSNNVLSPSNAGALWNWGLPWFGKIRRYTALDEMRR